MPAMSLFSGNLFLLLCLELEVYVPSFILFDSCSQHWSGLQQFLKDVRSALRKGDVEETQPAETQLQRRNCRGDGSSRVKSPVRTWCYRSHHAAWNRCLLPLFEQRKKCISCAQLSCKDGPCEVRPRVFTQAASLWIPREFLDTADLPGAHSTLCRFD